MSPKIHKIGDRIPDQNKLKAELICFSCCTLASAIMAFNLQSFVNTGGLFPGGFAGLTLLILRSLETYAGITLPYSAVYLPLNAVPIIIGIRFLGRKFTMYSIYVTVLTSILTDMIPQIPITYDILLICLFGGIINGAAISLCLVVGASGGGTDFISIFMSEKKGIDTYNYIFAANVVILALAGILFGWDKALYSIVYQFCTTQVIQRFFQRYNKTTLMIVTDLPDMERNSKLFKKVNNSLFDQSDAFILLTEHMNRRINKSSKPYIVLEGHVDSKAPMPEQQTPYELSDGKKVVMYAGSLKKIYGIGNLVGGFLKAAVPDSELRVYGDGDFKEELLRLCEMYPSVKYMGVRDNAHIVEEEQKASLLINPRPIAPEYTKYSFPSKNMEYMVSGTPLLTTGLPGMPEEYYPYVYIMGEETPDNAAKVIKKILDTPLSDRQKKGMAAREFVLQNKSNVIQAKKILEFLDYSVRKNNGT